MKHFFQSSLFIVLSLFCAILCIPTPTFAASFGLSSSSKQVAPNSNFTISVGGDCIGRVNLSVSNGTLSTSAVWVEENYQTVTVTAGASGSVTVTATPEVGFSDSDANEYKPGSRTVTVNIVAPTPPAPTTPTQPSNPTPTTPPASNSGNTTKPSDSNSSSNTSTPIPGDNPDTDDTTSEDPTEKPEDDENNDDSMPEETVIENDNNITDSTDCSEHPDNSFIAWIIAVTFACLFLITLGILIYFIHKTHQTPDQNQTKDLPKSKTNSTSAKSPKKSKIQKVQVS